jgi:hypothetical protein
MPQKQIERKAKSSWDRKVLTATAKKIFTLDWIKMMQGVVRAFMEFTEEKLCASPNHPEHDAEYFKPQGLALNENLVRQFLLWYADTAPGKDLIDVMETLGDD